MPSNGPVYVRMAIGRLGRPKKRGDQGKERNSEPEIQSFLHGVGSDFQGYTV
jgi:hypothetical protein